MSIHLQRDLATLEQNLLDQSAMVESMVFHACNSLRDLNTDLFEQIRANEDHVNRNDVAIEEECLKILALHQPVAVDLRRVATILKINGDLERIADLAVNICERTNSLVKHPEFRLPGNLDQMAEVAVSMLRNALDAFVRLDVKAAHGVRLRDDIVDDLNRQVISELVALMQRDPMNTEAALHFYSASRHVERIGDHATNVAEDVIYLVEGEIARHRYDEVTN